MTEFQRVVVTAPPGPQMVLADRFPAEEYDPDRESDTIEMVADPDNVNSFIEREGEHSGWAQWVENVEVEPIDDPSALPYKLRGLVEEEEARVWKYARELIPSGEDLDEYINHNRVSFTWSESVSGWTPTSTPTVETLETWVEDEYLQFDRVDANPTQNPNYDGGDGPVFDWAQGLESAHPDAELRVTGDLRSPSTRAPHGSATLNGLAVSMEDGGDLREGVVRWCENRFQGEFKEGEGYVGNSNEFIGQAHEFDVRETDGREWVRMWWD